jgi:hypothetical protein
MPRQQRQLYGLDCRCLQRGAISARSSWQVTQKDIPYEEAGQDREPGPEARGNHPDTQPNNAGGAPQCQPEACRAPPLGANPNLEAGNVSSETDGPVMEGGT